MGSENWEALGAAVKARREQLRLGQDLIDKGGPGAMTVRKIEHGEAGAIRPKTKSQLELALHWPQGLVDRLLDGEAAPDEAVRPLWQPAARGAGGTAAVGFSGTGRLTPGGTQSVLVGQAVESDSAGAITPAVVDTWDAFQDPMLRAGGNWVPIAASGNVQVQLAGRLMGHLAHEPNRSPEAERLLWATVDYLASLPQVEDQPPIPAERLRTQAGDS